MQLSYTITNTGNGMDFILFNSRSFATPFCDDTKRQEINGGGTQCELSTPVSDNCDEELFAKDADYPEANVNVRWFLDVGESFTRTLSFAGNMDNTSCWPTNSNGDYNLVFTQETRVISDFQQGYCSTCNNNWTIIPNNLFQKYGEFDFVWFDCGGYEEYQTFFSEYWSVELTCFVLVVKPIFSNIFFHCDFERKSIGIFMSYLFLLQLPLW